LDGEEEDAGQEEQAYHQFAGCHHDECCFALLLHSIDRAHGTDSELAAGLFKGGSLYVLSFFFV
jgi:hypothetical protein